MDYYLFWNAQANIFECQGNQIPKALFRNLCALSLFELCASESNIGVSESSSKAHKTRVGLRHMNKKEFKEDCALKPTCCHAYQGNENYSKYIKHPETDYFRPDLNSDHLIS